MVARVAVGVVLLVAGGAKLRQPSWPSTAVAFGLPRRLAPFLPWAELVLGALLVPGVGLPWTPLTALVLLGSFTAAVGWRLARGEGVPCGCFGETSTAPVGTKTLMRNLALCGLAVVAATSDRGGGPASGAAGAVVGLLIVAGSHRRPADRR